MDSLAIATYLDETYPETPKVLAPAARAILERVVDTFSYGSGGAGAPGDGKTDPDPSLVFIVLGGERLNPISKAYHYETRAARLGEQWKTLLDAFSASPEDRAERVRQGIEAIRGVWGKVTALYEQGTSGGPFVLGEDPCFVDFTVAGRARFILDGLAPSEVEMLTSLEGGRLVRLVEDLERYFKY